MPQLMLFRLIYNRKSFKLLNAKKYWVASRESSSLKDCFTLYLNSGRRKTMSQLFFLNKTSACFPRLQSKVQKPSLQCTKTPPVLVQTPEFSQITTWVPELSSQGCMASMYEGRISSTFLLKISLQDVPSSRNEFPGTHKWTPGLHLSDAELRGPRASSRKEQGEVEGSRKSSSPWLRSVCVNKESVPTDRHKGWLSCILLCWMCSWAPWEAVALCPNPKPQGCCYCSTACLWQQQLSTWGIAVPEWQSC